MTDRTYLEVTEMQALARSLSYGNALATFRPNETFHSPETQSDYVKGQLYTIREAKNAKGEVVKSPLQSFVAEWVESGKVELT